ncbi:MAG: site-2 protease family protein [Gemmatimonadota bacterium]
MELVLLLPVLVMSVVAHEYAHGWVALKQGDDTALRRGRLTLNPVPHLDLFGSILVPAVLWASNTGFIFGWAKPVPVDPRNFRTYRRGDILVSLAGVTANALLAAAFTLLLAGLVFAERFAPGFATGFAWLRAGAWFGVLINLILAVFNLIPIPPLDGSHLVYHLLPARLGARYREMGRFGLLILIGIMFLVPEAFRVVLWPVTALQDVAEAFVRMWA